MVKLTPLKLIQPGRDQPETPADLAEAGRQLWLSITSEFDVSDAEGRLMLHQAALAADRVEAIRQRVNEDGEMLATRAGLKAHPLLRDEIQGRAFITKTIARLGLRLEPIKAPGRPSGGRG